MLVSDAMSHPAVTVRANLPVEDALDRLDRHSLTMMPVVSPAGLIVGVVTEADLVREVVRPYARPGDIPAQRQRPEPPRRAPLRPRTVVEVMNHQAVTVRGDAELSEAVDLMTGSPVQSVPVIDGHHRVIGVISRRDVARRLSQEGSAAPRSGARDCSS
jgi:CBS-domain-containing membrane protein